MKKRRLFSFLTVTELLFRKMFTTLVFLIKLTFIPYVCIEIKYTYIVCLKDEVKFIG